LTAKVTSLNANLASTREELDTLKFAMAHERSSRAEERKKGDARDEKIVQSVTRLQMKLKVSPTLQTELQKADSAPAIAAAATGNAASAPIAATAAIGKKADVAAPVPKAAGEKPIVVTPKTKAAGKKVSVAPSRSKPKPKSESSEKTSAQVKALKEAIEKFNKE
jgi:hypothetical protein